MSEIKIPMLWPSNFDEADVKLKAGRLRKIRSGLKSYAYKPYTIFNQDVFYYEVPDICKFRINGKEEIIIDKKKQAKWLDVWAFFFDTPLGIILIKHDIFTFHASAIKKGKKGYMFCASAGGGKSTLAIHFAKLSSARIIEDDKCMMFFDDKKKAYYIQNNLPFMELWKPQMHGIKKVKDISAVSRVRSNIQKIRLDISKHSPKRSNKIDTICLIEIHNGEDEIEIKEIKGIQKVNFAINHSHMAGYINPLKKNIAHFQHMAQVVKNVKVYHIKRSRVTKIDKFIKFIENEIID